MSKPEVAGIGSREKDGGAVIGRDVGANVFRSNAFLSLYLHQSFPENPAKSKSKDVWI